METIYWIIFLMNEISRKKRIELLLKYKTPERIVKLNKEELSKEHIKEELINEEKIKHAQNDIINMKKYGIIFINIYDENYPIYLRQIYDPPIGLFVKRQCKSIK